MAFVKYTADMKSAKAEPDVRMSASSIVVTESGLAKYPVLSDASYLELYYSEETREIGLSPATDKSKDAFKFSQRGRGKSKVVSAGRFLQKFGLSGEANLNTDGMLNMSGDMLTFKLGTGKTRTRRGRRAKNADVPTA